MSAVLQFLVLGEMDFQQLSASVLNLVDERDVVVEHTDDYICFQLLQQGGQPFLVSPLLEGEGGNLAEQRPIGLVVVDAEVVGPDVLVQWEVGWSSALVGGYDAHIISMSGQPVGLARHCSFHASGIKRRGYQIDKLHLQSDYIHLPHYR